MLQHRIDVVKGQGKRPTELFDPEKLHASIIATCRSVRAPEAQAEAIAVAVVQGVLAWCHQRPEITSADIRRVAIPIINTYHTEAAYLYRQYRRMV